MKRLKWTQGNLAILGFQCPGFNVVGCTHSRQFAGALGSMSAAKGRETDCHFRFKTAPPITFTTLLKTWCGQAGFYLATMKILLKANENELPWPICQQLKEEH